MKTRLILPLTLVVVVMLSGCIGGMALSIENLRIISDLPNNTMAPWDYVNYTYEIWNNGNEEKQFVYGYEIYDSEGDVVSHTDFDAPVVFSPALHTIAANGSVTVDESWSNIDKIGIDGRSITSGEFRELLLNDSPAFDAGEYTGRWHLRVIVIEASVDGSFVKLGSRTEKDIFFNLQIE